MDQPRFAGGIRAPDVFLKRKRRKALRGEPGADGGEFGTGGAIVGQGGPLLDGGFNASKAKAGPSPAFAGVGMTLEGFVILSNARDLLLLLRVPLHRDLDRHRL